MDKTTFKKYVQVVGKKPPNYVLDLASLPPTSAAAREHSLRVYHQVQAWRGNPLVPTEWGWKVENGQHIPTTTMLPPAPNHLLHLVRCNCKAGCEKNCECRKGGLKCSTMCGECAGESCSNRPEIVIDDDIPVDEFDDPDDPPVSARTNLQSGMPKRSSSTSGATTKRQRKTTK